MPSVRSAVWPLSKPPVPPSWRTSRARARSNRPRLHAPDACWCRRARPLPGHTTIAVRHPKLALIRAAEALHPAPTPPPGIHPTAVVAPDAQLAPDCSVGANVVIESGVTVGAGTRLCAGSLSRRGRARGRALHFASSRHRLPRRANWRPRHSPCRRGDRVGRFRLRLCGRAAREVSAVGKDRD